MQQSFFLGLEKSCGWLMPCSHAGVLGWWGGDWSDDRNCASDVGRVNILVSALEMGRRERTGYHWTLYFLDCK